MTDAEHHAFPCPACGFMSFSEPSGSFEICAICGWEDDHVQLAHPSSPIGANGQSLYDAQQQVLREIPLSVQEQFGVARDPSWRPLEEAEARSVGRPRDGLSYFEAASDESADYYWRVTADERSDPT